MKVSVKIFVWGGCRLPIKKWKMLPESVAAMTSSWAWSIGAGGHLSGGERQRIAIARAMLKDAPIIIFDEATAYLDPENESLIQEAISKLVQGKTLIMVAHRLYTVTGANQLVVVNQGRIEATGTHEELLKKCPLYKEMWKAHIGSRDEGGATA